MHNSRIAQAAIEYVILVGVILVFLIPVIHYSLNEANISLKINQLDNSVRRVAKAADAVLAVGGGAAEIVTITLPYGIESSTVGSNRVALKVSMFGSFSDVVYTTRANVAGNLPISPGTYRIVVKALNNNTVIINPISQI